MPGHFFTHTQVVRPRCAYHRCCLHNLLPLEHCGKPSVFISHTWSRPLKDLVDSLTAYFAEALDPPFVWLVGDIGLKSSACDVLTHKNAHTRTHPRLLLAE